MTQMHSSLFKAKVQHDQQLRLLPFECIKRVKELKLNHKWYKRRQNIRIPHKQLGYNNTNIIRIKKQGHKSDQNIIFATCNIQSVHYKELQVSELINDYSLDFLLLTEMWLNDKLNGWKDCTVLNKDGLSFIYIGQTQQKRWRLSTNTSITVQNQIT